MAQINNNSLFHYTPKFENLIGILKNGLKYSVLDEDLPLQGYHDSLFSIPDVIKYHKYANVVCFCDIPLRNIKEHLQQYGEYGLGLDKEWSMMKGISPVRYFHYYTPDLQNEGLMNAITYFSAANARKLTTTHMIVQELKRHGRISKFEQEDFEALPYEVKEILHMYDREYKKSMHYNSLQLDYVRSYSGKWKDRVTGEITNRIFYYENEWRAVPESEDDKFLYFEPNVITCIIVKLEEEKKKLLELNINGIEGKIFLLNEIEKS